MMEGSHPNDVEQLEYVEGELDETAAASIRAHVAGCEDCARELAETERARKVLHAAPALRLPDGRLDAMLATLPPQEPRERDVRSFIESRRRLLLVATPAAAALVAVVIAFAVSGGGGENREAGEAAAAQTAGADESLEAAPAQDAAAAPVVRVQGPPRAIVRFLRAEGFTARREEGRVIVVGAPPRQVRQALADRPRGDVPVFVLPGNP